MERLGSTDVAPRSLRRGLLGYLTLDDLRAILALDPLYDPQADPAICMDGTDIPFVTLGANASVPAGYHVRDHLDRYLLSQTFVSPGNCAPSSTLDLVSGTKAMSDMAMINESYVVYIDRSCIVDADCCATSDVCFRGACNTKGRAGQACASNADCLDGLQCDYPVGDDVDEVCQ